LPDNLTRLFTADPGEGHFLMPRGTAKSKKNNGANIGFEAQLWAAADALLANPLVDENETLRAGTSEDGF